MIRHSSAALSTAAAALVALSGLVGIVGCNSLTKPDDIAVAPEPRRPGAAASAAAPPPASGRPTAPPAGH